MGRDLELDFDKYCVVDGSPKTVLVSPHHSKVEKRKKPKRGNERVFLSHNKKCIEIKVRKKIEFSRRNGAPISFDSLCSSDEEDSSLGSLQSLVNKESQPTRMEDRQSQSIIPLHKSLSARVGPHSPKSKLDSSKSLTPKTRFGPLRKIFDPLTKSKFQKSPFGSSRNIASRESFPHDCSKTKWGSKDSCRSNVSSCSSPAHSNGVMKMENKKGVPFFEFSVKNPPELLVAKTWKLGNDSNWVYTFHHNGGQGSKDGQCKDFITMVGQMQVSCYLCTKLANVEAFHNMVTEFILYDLTHPKQSSEQDCESNDVIDQEKVNVFTSNPLFVKDLHPDLETAAVVISKKRESKVGDTKDVDFPDLSRIKPEKNTKDVDFLDLSGIKLEEEESECVVSVVIPSGSHGLASGESCGPLPLLDRWRLGGGCDCGGWDMGCPLVVLGNPDVDCKQPVELFQKGGKEKTPALTLKVNDEGQYAVEFNAQLSSLQAFSICVAILHTTQPSIDINHQTSIDVQRDSMEPLIKVVTDETPPFLFNPPFSPMSRA